MPEKSTLFEFDVFLSHNSKDKPTVRQLDEALKQRALKVWLDERDLIPGQPWEEALEQIIGTVRSVAVLIGNDGLGPWENVEMRAFLTEFVSRKAPVIPVLLPGAPAQPNLPMFLTRFTWVDLRGGLSQHGLDRLVLGITYNGRNQPTLPPTPVIITPPVVIPAPVVKPVVIPTPVVKPTDRREADMPAQPKSRTSDPFNTGELQIVTCFLHQERWEKLRHLREWTAKLNEQTFGKNPVRVSPAANLKEAFTKVRQKSEATILLLDGFKPEGAQLDEFVDPRLKPRPFHMIFNAPEFEEPMTVGNTASILQHTHAVTQDDTLLPTLRKALLRVRTLQFVERRVLTAPEDLAKFFELRYQVWNELKYLAPEKASAQTPWELDFTDRTSLPFGIFAKADGRLLGGGRLVRAFGREYHSLSETVEKMLRSKGTESLLRNFQYPTGQTHPFDILGELNQFKEYYHDIVIHNISKAEISRIVVAADCRNLGLGEVIVDTLCSLARIHAIERLFLACHTKHAGFYERCGFRAIPGVKGDKFLSYPVPCIAMERTVSGVKEMIEDLAMQTAQ